MATPNPLSPGLPPLTTVAPARDRESPGRSAPDDAALLSDGVQAERPTLPVALDDSAVTPAPDNGPGDIEGVDGNAWPDVPAVPEISARFRGQLGHYRIEDFVYQPGAGLTFRAEDLSRHRPVMLRVFKPNGPPEDPVWTEFVKGVHADAAVKAPNLATVYEVGEDKGALFVATEVLAGESLEKRLMRGSLPLSQAFRVVRETALAIAAAHDAGSVHCDLMPAKIWLVAPGDGPGGNKTAHERPLVKVLDLGLVWVEYDETGMPRRQLADGCQAYLAPEQARGGLGDAKSDMFTLGVLLFRLVTGGLPLPGEAPMNARMVPSASLVNLTNQLLSPDPKARPRSPAKVAAELLAIEQEIVRARELRRALRIGGGALAALVVTAALITLPDLLTSGTVVPGPPVPKSVDGKPLAPHQVAARVGDQVTVEFRVARVERGPGGVTHIYANDPELKDEQFRLVVPYLMPRALLNHLQDRGLLQPAAGGGQTVRATGMVTREGPISEIMIRDSAQMNH